MNTLLAFTLAVGVTIPTPEPYTPGPPVHQLTPEEATREAIRQAKELADKLRQMDQSAAPSTTGSARGNR